MNVEILVGRKGGQGHVGVVVDVGIFVGADAAGAEAPDIFETEDRTVVQM